MNTNILHWRDWKILGNYENYNERGTKVRLISANQHCYSKKIKLTLQTCFLSSKWIFVCIFMQDFDAKNFSQIVHWCSLFTVFEWVWKCDKHNDFVMNRLSHSSHWYGFTPRCRFSWSIKPCFALKLKSHIEHLNGFSELCVFEWIVK